MAPTMTPEQMAAELQRLQAENDKLKAKQGSKTITLKVSEKKALSVYGLGRFPVTLYRSQWEALAKAMPAIQKFIADNASKLAEKE